MMPKTPATSTEPITPREPTPLAIPTLTTESGRFILRPFTLADASAIYEAMQDPRVSAPTTLPFPYPEGAAERWIASHPAEAEAGSDLFWAIAPSTTPDAHAIGAISIHLDHGHHRAEIGYWLGSPWWGQGITTEAARAVVAYGFESLGLHRIQARCLPDNIGSARVMEKCGMRFEGIMRDVSLSKGAFVDLAFYAVLEDDPIPGQTSSE